MNSIEDIFVILFSVTDYSFHWSTSIFLSSLYSD